MRTMRGLELIADGNHKSTVYLFKRLEKCSPKCTFQFYFNSFKLAMLCICIFYLINSKND